MRRCVFVTLALLSVGSGLVAQMANQEVMKAEQAKLDARRKGDSAAHGSLIADDFAQVSHERPGPGQEICNDAACGSEAGRARSKSAGNGRCCDRDWYAVRVGCDGAGFSLHARVAATGRSVGQRVRAHDSRPAAGDDATPAPAATTPPAAPPPTAWPEGKTQDEREVMKVQRGLNDAFAKKDATAYGQLDC